MAVHSDQWEEHLIHSARFLKTIRDARLTLNLKKCRWAQNQVKFCGEILGSGQIYRSRKGQGGSRNENTTDKDRIEMNSGILLIFS